jgi:hypothetical protein
VTNREMWRYLTRNAPKHLGERFCESSDGKVYHAVYAPGGALVIRHIDPDSFGLTAIQRFPFATHSTEADLDVTARGHGLEIR